ncbi:MAG: response regulator transcription factor [Clostridia bacterium]|nr:response regulator transcription factor [Clostridia bacterium]
MNIYFFDEDSLNLKHIYSVAMKLKRRGYEVYINIPSGNMLGILKENGDNVIFIDTRLSAEGGSFAIAQAIRACSDSTHIIFMSSHIEDMSFCFKNLMRPSGFLLKPVDETEVSEIVDKIVNKIKKKKRLEDMLYISTHEYKRTVNIDQILYFATFGKKILCKTSGGESIEFYSTIKSLEKRFSKDFIRCHNGFLANKKMITGLNKGMLKIKNCEETIPVSKTYKQAVELFLKNGA